jgi:hypothetical protein
MSQNKKGILALKEEYEQLRDYWLERMHTEKDNSSSTYGSYVGSYDAYFGIVKGSYDAYFGIVNKLEELLK